MPQGDECIELAPSDPAQLQSLASWLADIIGVRIERVPTTPGPGEQGALDALAVLASSSATVAAVKVLPEFIRSRRSNFRIEITVRDEKVVLDATNADTGVERVLARLLESDR